MLVKKRNKVEIPIEEWEKLRNNPAFSDAIELWEDISDLDKARKVKGKDLTLDEYLEKRKLRNNS